MVRLPFLAAWRTMPGDIRAFLLYSLLSGIGIGVFLTLFNLYLLRIGFREDFIGLFSGVNTLALAATAAGLGPLINRFGTVQTFRVGLTVFSASSLGLCLVTEPLALLMVGLINGAAWAALIVPNMPFVMERVPEERRTAMSSLSFGVQMLSMTIGTLLGGLLPPALMSLALDEIARARLTLIGGVALAALGLPPLWRISTGLVHRPVIPLVQTIDTGERRTIRRDIGVFALTGALLALGAGATQPFFNVYFVDLGASTAQIGLIFSLSNLLGAGITLLAPALTRRLGPLPALLITRACPLPLYLPLIFVASMPIAATAYAARIASFSVAWPIEAGLIGNLVPERHRATTFGLRSASWNSAWAIASFLAGQVIVRAGYAPIFAWFIIASVAALIVTQYYFGRRLAATAVPGTPAAGAASVTATAPAQSVAE